MKRRSRGTVFETRVQCFRDGADLISGKEGEKQNFEVLTR